MRVLRARRAPGRSLSRPMHELSPPLFHFQGQPSRSSIARVERNTCSLQACLLYLQGWRLIDLPLRASNEGFLFPFRTITTFRSRESPDCLSLRTSNEHILIVRVLRARRMVRRLPSSSSETARCTSTGDHLVCPLMLLLRARVREHRTNVGALPIFLLCAFCEQEGHLAAPYKTRSRISAMTV